MLLKHVNTLLAGQISLKNPKILIASQLEQFVGLFKPEYLVRNPRIFVGRVEPSKHEQTRKNCLQTK